jgi:HK97 family phage portal protein
MVSDLRHPTAWLSAWALPSRTLAGIDVSPAAALTLAAYYAAVRAISEDVGKLPFITYERLRPRGKQRAPWHPLYAILHDAPNPFMAAMTWRESLTQHALTWGNGYAPILREAGRIVGLGPPLHPSRVEPRLDDQGALVYRVTMGGSSGIRAVHATQETLWLPQRDVFHLRGLGDGFLGYSVAQLAAESMGVSLAAQRFGAAYFANGTHMGGILTHPATLGDKATVHLRDSLNSFRLSEDAMKVMILEEGMTFEKIGIPPEDSQFLQCTTPETLFTLADGTRCRADQLGRGMSVLSWDTRRGQLTTGTVRAIGTRSPRPLIRVTTDRGRVLTTTPDHPYWSARRRPTRGGRYPSRPLSALATWVPAESLQCGDYVRIAVGPEIPGTKEIDFQTGWLLGALVGDGYIRAGAVGFTSNVEAVTGCMRQCLAAYGATLRAATTKDYIVCTGGLGRRSSPFRKLLNSTGLVGTHSQTKFVPDMVIRSGRDAWAGFLSGYLDTDGAVWGQKKKQPAVWWASTSRRLLQECQHLLLLLGIQSSLYGGSTGYAHTTGFPNGAPIWNLYVVGHSQMHLLAATLRPSHPEKATRLQAVRPPVRGAHPDFFLYDRIARIESIPAASTIGVEISQYHSHVTEGIVTHNTRQFQTTEIARWFRIPPHKIAEMSHSTYTNIEHQAQEYVVDTLQPWLVRWEQEAKRKLFADDPDLFAEHLVLGLLRGDQQARSNYYRTLFYIGALSPNDIRELENQNPLVDADGEPDPAGNMYFTQNNLATLGAIAGTSAPSGMPSVGGAPNDLSEDEDDTAEEEDGDDTMAFATGPPTLNGHHHEGNGA